MVFQQFAEIRVFELIFYNPVTIHDNYLPGYDMDSSLTSYF